MNGHIVFVVCFLTCVSWQSEGSESPWEQLEAGIQHLSMHTILTSLLLILAFV